MQSLVKFRSEKMKNPSNDRENKSLLLPKDDRCSTILWRKSWCPCIPARIVVVAWSFLGMSVLYALRVTLPIAIVAMVDDAESSSSRNNSSTSYKVGCIESVAIPLSSILS